MVSISRWSLLFFWTAVESFEECGDGYYWNSTFDECLVCPAGKYTETTGSLNCTDCPAGKYLEDDGLNWKFHTLELLCALCPSGKSSSLLGASMCEDCEIGKFSGGVGNTQCASCTIGSGVARWTGATACETCYSGMEQNANATDCDMCPMGRFGGGATGCSQCEAGKYTQWEGSSSCSDCLAGTYPADNASECLSCPEGRYGSSSGATSCTLCPRGKFSELPASSQCDSCGAGTYAVAGSSFCASCWGGYFSAAEAFQCTRCRPGYYASNGSESCSACYEGQYPNTAQDQCEDCPAGTKKSANDFFCTACDGGYYSSAGAMECYQCSAGSFSSTDRSTCESCPIGTVSSDASSSCTACAAGKIPDFYGETCEDCYAGTYQPAAGNSTCISCEAGRYSSQAASTVCSDCPIGRFSDSIGAASESDCQECPGTSTLLKGSKSSADCILPDQDQSFECIVGKPCVIGNLQGTGLVEKHSVMVKAEVCEIMGSGYGYSTGSSGAYVRRLDVSEELIWPDSFSGYGFGVPDMATETTQFSNVPSSSELGRGRRLEGDDSTVAGFGPNGRSQLGSSNYTWPGVVQADPGTYRLCWCGGLSELCSAADKYLTDVGVISISGPFTDQEFSCVKGQSCSNKGPILGLGLTGHDEIVARGGCTLDWARGNGAAAGTRMNVQALSAESGLTGEFDLYASFSSVVQIPAGDYNLCWCSSKGQSCSDMDFSSGTKSTLYLEHSAATFIIEGPGVATEAECFTGQQCSPSLSDGKNLKAGDRITAMEQCGQGLFLRGLPGTGIGQTDEGHDFQFIEDANSSLTSSRYLESDPGFFRLCWCRPSNFSQCDQPADFNVAAGLFIATGPYSGQSFQCQFGSRCIVMETDLRGVSLASGDQLLPLAECVGVVPSRTFLQPQSVPGTVNASSGAYHFDLGYLELNSSKPEVLQLCWCSARSSQCDEAAGYRQVAMTLYVACPPGFYELQVAVGALSQCQECPMGYYCAGGWPAHLALCPAGSTSPRGSSLLTHCECRRGFYWDDSLGACLTCPPGFYKNLVGQGACDAECPDGSVSYTGAADVWECVCPWWGIDTDPALESFECVELSTLANTFHDTSTYAATAANVFLFSGSLKVADASTEALLTEIHQRLSQFLDLTGAVRASLNRSVRQDTGAYFLDFSLWSSDPELAGQLHNKFDALPFEAWVSSLRGSALDSAQLVSRSEVESFLLQCPAGLGLREGRHVIDMNDCMCPHGKQPAVSGVSGLAGGCVRCPLGKYKSSVGDTACVSCPVEGGLPLTTLQEGAISHYSCSCSGGHFAPDFVNDPSACEPCGLGFFCSGVGSRQACSESQTTVDEAASSITECLCAPGFLDAGSGACQACPAGKYKDFVGSAQCSDCAAGTFANEGEATCEQCDAGRFATAGAGICDPCPAGRYSPNPAAASVDSCALCPIGTWGNTAAASLMSACIPCVSGSTTALPAADSEALCARPDAAQSKTCISGRTCAIYGIAGSSMQDGHRMAITSSACSDAKLAVSGIISSGISKAATQNGSSYAWGDVYTDFSPLGGVYNLCWCASMGILTCDNLNSNFVIAAGQLLVEGPFANELECLRGSDCTDLAFGGYDLLATDQIAVRRDACGGSVAAQISISNVNGLGDLETNGSDWVLGFGVSTNDHDYHLYIDASNAGYFLCWCASERGLNTACATADFAVYAGRLRVTGPNVNQESACAVGQECSVTGIRGVSMQSEDRLMILSDCGKGNAIPGLPANGILDTTDGSSFAFVGGVSSVVLSVPGIFRICFCRPTIGSSCETVAGFQARVGLMTASGPFEQTTECQLSSNCTVDVSGIGLDVGDQLFFTSSTCGSSDPLSQLGYTKLQDPLLVEDGASSLQVVLGELPISAIPGLYSICWCPKSAACTSPALFRAPAGLLQVVCPPGTFAVGPSTGQTCESCTRGYYCAGGRPEIAARVSCADGKTTASKGSVTINACVCDRGFRLDVASSACVVCDLNSYKSQPGNLEACTPCPSGSTTYTTGSVWASSCHMASDVPGDIPSIPGGAGSNDSGNGSDNDTDSGNSTAVQPAQPATQNESSVPAVTFNMSLSNFPVEAGAADLKEQLKAVFARTLSATTRLDQNAIQIDIIGLDASNSSRLRRLAAPTGPTVVITIKARSPEEAAETASDMDVNVVTSEVMTAVQQHPTLADIGIQLTPESEISITTATVTCPQHQAVPPGVPVLSPEDCQCSPGYSPAADTCEPCRRGKYKVDVSNGACTDCPQLMSTLNEGATSMLECQCEAGLYANGACITCLEGFYCPGTGQAVACPENSTTLSAGSSQQSACICLAGYYFASAELWCEPCQRRRYKPNQGNGECALTCPTNADSELASTSLDDCFCTPGFHANIDSAGKLASCTACSYQGLICEGGFVKANLTNLTNLSIPQVHAQPLAKPGFYQTRQSSSVECDVLLPDGSSACLGGDLCVAQRLDLPTPPGCNGVFGNACAEGSTGMLCGECPEGFSRDNYPELCQPCPSGASALLSVGILSDIFQKAFLNFVVAAMAATSAVKGSAKLHTSMIRIGTQWLAACSVINQFNLDRLSGFEWAQKQAEMDQLTACSEANATECVLDQQAGNFAWPKEISDAINWVFNLMTIAPRLGSVEFSAQCHAEELLPGDKLAKMVAPGIYYISSPLLAMIGVLLVCSVMVYVVVPLFAMAGIYFNNAAKAKQKKEKIIKELKKALEPLLPDAGLSWKDVQDSKILEEHHAATLESAALEPQKFIEGGFSYCRPLAVKMCLHHLASNTDAAESWKKVGLTWDEFTERPDFIAQDLGTEDEGLSAAANGKIWSSLLDTLVLRALAWKLRDRYPELPEVEQEKIAHAVASAHDSASSLFETSAKAEEFELIVQSQYEQIRHSPVEEGAEEGKQSNDLDPDALDFGLFTPFPTPRQLLQLCPPVFWVTLLAMWPELLSKFLQMVWCTPISGEDADGKILVQQRLLPHPDVVCWSGDHFATALIAGIGLGVWCALVPILLFLRIYNLKDRQSPENFRRYGYFIEGYEPQFWWWDILVKRTDIGLMNLVTYTSLADDEKAKLLLFPFISGGMLAVAAWCKPFANTQAEILDFLEMSLLSFRFVLFSAVCMLLIFNPSPEATYAVAGTLALLLACICAYFGLHVLVQILRTTADESSEEEDFETPKTGKTGLSQSQAEAKKKKQNPLVRFVGNVKKRVVNLALPLFQESEDEKLLVEWSVQNNSCKLVSAAIVHRSQRQLVKSSSGRAVAMAKGARAQLLRFGAAYQKRTITKAFEEFATLWLDQFDQETLPADTVQVLCALTSSSKHVPARVPKRHLAARWQKKAEELLHHHSLLSKSEISTWHFAADDLLDTTQRMSKLAAKDAVHLVNGTQMALQEHRDRHAFSLIVREPVQEEPQEPQEPEEPAVPREGSPGLPLDSQESEVPVMPVPVPDTIDAVKDVVMVDRAVQTSLTLPVKKAAPAAPVQAIEAPEALPVSERKKPKERAPEAPQGDVDLKDVFAKLLASRERKAPRGPSGPSRSPPSWTSPAAREAGDAPEWLGQSSPSQPSQPQAMPAAEVFFIPSQEVQTLPPSPGGRKVAKHPRPVSPNTFLRPKSPSRSASPKGPKSESDSGSRSQSPAPAVRSVMPQAPEAVPPGSSAKSSKATQSERASS